MIRPTRNVQKMASYASIANGATVAVGNITCNNLRQGMITVRTTYNGAATSTLTLSLYYSPDGINFDTVAYSSFIIDLTAGSTVQESHVFDLPEEAYIYVTLTNSSGQAVTNTTVWYVPARYGDVYFEGDKLVSLMGEMVRKQSDVYNAILTGKKCPES